MKRITGLNRILGLLLLSLWLQGLFSSPNYNQRLELFNPTTDPTAAPADSSKPARKLGASADSRQLAARNIGKHLRPSDAGLQSFERQVYAAVPLYQEVLFASLAPRLWPGYQKNLYASDAVSLPSGRGPPSFTV